MIIFLHNCLTRHAHKRSKFNKKLEARCRNMVKRRWGIWTLGVASYSRNTEPLVPSWRSKRVNHKRVAPVVRFLLLLKDGSWRSQISARPVLNLVRSCMLEHDIVAACYPVLQVGWPMLSRMKKTQSMLPCVFPPWPSMWFRWSHP